MSAPKAELANHLLHGEPASAPTKDHVVLAHGFTQNARCWGTFADVLAAQLPAAAVAAIDLPGHGDSGHDDVSLTEAGSLLAAALHPGRTTVIGYSMGGRIALHAALADPHAIDALVLIGATAGIDAEDERGERRTADAALADRLLTDGLPAFLDRWLAAPLFATLPSGTSALEQRLRNRPEGLAATLRNRGTGSQEPLWDQLDRLAMPVLVIAGQLDAKFVAIGERMTATIGDNAIFSTIAGTGHAAHLEQPAETANTISDWLADISPRR